LLFRTLTRAGVFFQLRALPRGQHTYVAPILGVDIVDDDMDVFQLLPEVIKQGAVISSTTFLF